MWIEVSGLSVLVAVAIVAEDDANQLANDFVHRFETRSFPNSLAATRRGLTFYVADPVSFIRRLRRFFGRADFGFSESVKIPPGCIALLAGSCVNLWIKFPAAIISAAAR